MYEYVKLKFVLTFCSTILFQIKLKNGFVPHRKRCDVLTNLCVLYTEIIAVYSVSYEKIVNTLYARARVCVAGGGNEKFFDTYSEWFVCANAL